MSKAKSGGAKDPAGTYGGVGSPIGDDPYGGKILACVWQYQKSAWVLLKAECPPGYVAGPPPREKGAYEGECKRGPCVPKSAGRG